MLVRPQPDFSRAFEAENYASTYTNSYNASASIGIDCRLFNFITGNVFIVSGEKRFPVSSNVNRVNIGLKLKSMKYKEQVSGYTRIAGNQFLYSQKAAELVDSYCQRFPRVFELLKMNSGVNDMIFESQLNEGRPEGSPSMLREISEWLKEQPHNKAVRQNIGSLSLEHGTIKSIIDAVERLKSKPVRSIKLQVKPHYLYKPNLNDISVEPDSRADFRIFDRVVVARDGYIVPLGAHGTVISINPQVDENPLRLENVNSVEYSYEVLFDEPFEGAQSIDDIAVKRVFNVRQSVLINISFGIRLANPTRANQPKADEKAATRNDWRARNDREPQSGMDANIWPKLNINRKGTRKQEEPTKPIVLWRNNDKASDVPSRERAEQPNWRGQKDRSAKPLNNSHSQFRNKDLAEIPLPKQFEQMNVSNVNNKSLKGPAIVPHAFPFTAPPPSQLADGSDALRKMLRLESHPVDAAPRLEESLPIDLNQLFGKPLLSAAPAPGKIETTMLPKPPLNWHKPGAKSSPDPGLARPHTQQFQPPSSQMPPMPQMPGQPRQYNDFNHFIQNQMQSVRPMQVPHPRPWQPPMPFVGFNRMPVPLNKAPAPHPMQQQYRGMVPPHSNVRIVGPIAANFQQNAHQPQQRNQSGPKGPQTLNNSSNHGHGAFIPLQAALKSAKPANKSTESQPNAALPRRDAPRAQPAKVERQENAKNEETKQLTRGNEASNKKSIETKPKNKSNPRPAANRPKRLACKFDLSPA